MAHKTFISYKYSEARGLRDRIINALGSDATYYKGEGSDSPDLTDLKTATIKEHLKDMIFDTSVTIVILSPNMTQSHWIDWEIEYSLREYSRNGRASKRNGVVAVVQKHNGDYDWLIKTHKKEDGHTTESVYEEKLFNIINKNRFNQVPKVYACENCRSFDMLNSSYIAIVKEDFFLSDPNFFIENAYEKSQDKKGYDIKPTR